MVKSSNYLVNKIVKFYYKKFNKPLFHEFKVYLDDKKLVKDYHEKFEPILKRNYEAIKSKKELNFVHSGHIGDLMYSLLVIKELSKTKKCNLIIKVNQTLPHDNTIRHPLGNILITDKVYNMMLPLLKSQEFLSSVTLYSNQDIDVDLNLFRSFPFSNQFHSIRWYFHLVGLHVDMSLPYLTVSPHEKLKNKIVIVRTFRGRNPIINYKFLNKYDDLLFIGTKDEYGDFVQEVPNAVFYNVTDFLEFAQIMQAARLVITNQTFAFAVAEGLKANRLLEANPYFPVVFPIGGVGFDFYFQEQFEKLVSDLD